MIQRNLNGFMKFKESDKDIDMSRVIQCLKNQGPQTRLEISQKTGIPEKTLCFKLRELEYINYVVKGGKVDNRSIYSITIRGENHG